LVRKQAILICLGVVCAGLLFATAADTATAAPIRIVAFGSSETAGYGVGSGEAWPERLQAMLRARGYDVSIANEGVSGDTTEGMLARLDSAVPNDTRIAMLAIYYYNDGLYGVSQTQHDANVRTIMSRLRARGIRMISVGLQYFRGLPRQADGLHITAEGQATLAARLLPQVVAALRAPRR
jgi:acyl-CoA thioesterase I